MGLRKINVAVIELDVKRGSGGTSWGKCSPVEYKQWLEEKQKYVC